MSLEDSHKILIRRKKAAYKTVINDEILQNVKSVFISPLLHCYKEIPENTG